MPTRPHEVVLLLRLRAADLLRFQRRCVHRRPGSDDRPRGPVGVGNRADGQRLHQVQRLPQLQFQRHQHILEQTGRHHANHVRSAAPGDFVQLPTIQQGQQLSLVLWSNVNSSGVPGNTFYNDATANADKYQHVVAFLPSTTSQYIIVGFEDLYGGGDGDYNDVIVVVNVGPQNAALWLNVSTLPK